MNQAIMLKNVEKTFRLKEDSKSSLRSLFSSFFNQGKTREFKALHDINLSIKRGEFVGIIGRNGSGKSTLLKVISGIYSPDKKGKLKVNGQLVPFLELGVGFNSDLSGKENIYLNGTILGMTKKFLDKKLNEIIEFAELREFIDTPVKNYSSGMMVRLAFAIAIQAEAEIYILDEILSVGDAGFQKKSLDIFKEFKKKGKTVIFVSHDISSVREFCERVILLSKGEIIFDGDTEKGIVKYNELIINELNKGVKEKKDELVADDGNQILNVRFLNSNGRSTKVFKRGEDITISLDLEINTPIPDLSLGIGTIYYDDDSWITANNTSYDSFKPKWVNGKNHVELTFARNRFNGGKYYVLVSLFKKEPGFSSYYVSFDSRDKQLTFDVVNNDRRNGLVFMDHRWKANNSSKLVTLGALK